MKASGPQRQTVGLILARRDAQPRRLARAGRGGQHAHCVAVCELRDGLECAREVLSERVAQPVRWSRSLLVGASKDACRAVTPATPSGSRVAASRSREVRCSATRLLIPRSEFGVNLSDTNRRLDSDGAST